MEYNVKDNFLDEKYFKWLQDELLDGSITWDYQDGVAEDSDEPDFYFIHSLYNADTFQPDSKYFNTHFGKLINDLEVRALKRMRLIMYTNCGEQIVHKRHRDLDYDHTAALIYLNTNNGFTELDDGTRIDSIENRLLMFNGSELHSSSTCTDQKRRVLISLNYF
tara:strand:- start:12 stop:503 length:492 start_codon:yes stop_codon:yes gene_type:complete